MRLLAAVRSNQTTAGTWAAVPVESRLAELGGIERTGKKWRNLTASRAAATTYTNSTGQDLHISVVSGLSAGEALHLTVDSVIIQRNGSSSGGSQHSISACIPPGSTYSITIVAGTISGWFELR
jgi:hypothetical protein